MESLKSQVLALTTAEWVKENFGDLRLKATWEAALDRLSEAVAIAADTVKSEQAVRCYELIANVVLIIVIGLWLAAKTGFNRWVKPLMLSVWANKSEYAGLALDGLSLAGSFVRR